MLILRPTQSLAKRMRVKLVSTTEFESTTRTGDWYAKDVVINRRQLILASNTKSRLGLVVTAAPYFTFPERLPIAIAELLHSFGISKNSVEHELSEMRDIRLVKTLDRSTMGTLNEYAFHLQYLMRTSVGDSENLLAVSRKLSDIPSLVLEGTWPEMVTRNLFEGIPPTSSKKPAIATNQVIPKGRDFSM